MITLSTGSLYPYSLSRIFEIAYKAGFQGVELLLRNQNDNAYLDSWDVVYLKELEKKYNLKINSVHVAFDFNNNPQKFLEISNLAKKLKAKYIITHIPREDECVYKAWFHKFNFQNNNNVLVENIHYKKNMLIRLSNIIH